MMVLIEKEISRYFLKVPSYNGKLPTTVEKFKFFGFTEFRSESLMLINIMTIYFFNTYWFKVFINHHSMSKCCIAKYYCSTLSTSWSLRKHVTTQKYSLMQRSTWRRERFGFYFTLVQKINLYQWWYTGIITPLRTLWCKLRDEVVVTVVAKRAWDN